MEHKITVLIKLKGQGTGWVQLMLKAPTLSDQSDDGTLLSLAPVLSQTRKIPVTNGPPVLLARFIAPTYTVHSTHMYVSCMSCMCTDPSYTFMLAMMIILMMERMYMQRYERYGPYRGSMQGEAKKDRGTQEQNFCPFQRLKFEAF